MQETTKALLIWLLLAVIAITALSASLFSPLLEWRQPAYIVAGLAGVIALILLMFQPLLATYPFPRISRKRQRRLHQGVGIAVLAAVAAHVGGLWITSPPDVVDALLFVSPTLFTPFGVIAMWAVLLTVLLALVWVRIGLAPATWRKIHFTLAWIIIIGTVVHAMLIEGTMETLTKTALCVAAVLVLANHTYRQFSKRERMRDIRS